MLHESGQMIIAILAECRQQIEHDGWLGYGELCGRAIVVGRNLTPALLESELVSLRNLGLIESRDEGASVQNNSFRFKPPVFSGELTRFFSRHLVGLGIEYTSDTSRGFEVMSGFILEVGDKWVWGTAGHCVKLIEERQKKGEIISSRLLDGFGSHPATTQGLPISVTACCGWKAFDKDEGVDIGFLILPEFYRKGLIANGVVPFEFSNLCAQDALSFDGYCLCGIIAEWTKTTENTFKVSNGFFPVFQTDSVPESINKSFPRFYADVPRFQNMNSIVGMSGGPIFGFKVGSDGQLRYWLAAVQCGWDVTQRVLAACPATLFRKIFGEVIRRFSEDGDDTGMVIWP